MAKGQSRNKSIVVPEARKMLDQMKYEIAAELGLAIGSPSGKQDLNAEFAQEPGTFNNSRKEPYWGYMSSRDTGAVGGHMTRTLVAQAQNLLS